MKRTILFVAILAFFAFASVACAPEAAPHTNPQPVLNNDLENGALTLTHKFADEQFDFVTEFSSTYRLKYWHITEPKNILMRAYIKPKQGANVIVLVEHVHADAIVYSKYGGWDGTQTDSMDDSFHGTQGGFWITENYPYEEYFAVSGYSPTMWNAWSIFYTSWLGHTDAKPEPMTEKNLIHDGGTQGQKFQIVWDILIRYPDKGETMYHTRSVIDEFMVPVDQNP